MPQITVDHSADLDDRIDRDGLAAAVHQAAVDTVAARIPACKTRFRRVDATVVGDAAASLVHVEIGLLAGRTEEAKASLAEAVLAALPHHIKEPTAVHLSTEIRDLAPSYRSTVTP